MSRREGQESAKKHDGRCWYKVKKVKIDLIDGHIYTFVLSVTISGCIVLLTTISFRVYLLTLTSWRLAVLDSRTIQS